MKICFLTPSYPKTAEDPRAGFLQPYVEKLAKENEVIMITSSAPYGTEKFEIRNGVKIYRFNYFWPRRLQRLTHTDTGGMLESYKGSFFARLQVPFFLLTYALKTLRYARKCDIIDAQWLFSGFIALPCKWLYKKPIYCMERDGSIRGMPDWILKLTLKSMDLVNAWTPYHIKKIEDLGIKDKVKLTDVKSIIDFSRVQKKGDAKKLKKEFNIKNEKIVSYIARLAEMKDPLTFVRAIQSAIKNYKDVKFLMVGEGHLKNDVIAEIEKLGIKDKIILTGERTDVGAILDCTDIYIATGNVNHCFSAAIMEAFYKKKPCIITKAGEDEKGYRDREDVYFVENNPKALANGILDLLKNHKLRKKLSEAGPKFIKKNGFDHDEIIKKTNEIYTNLINAS